MHRIAIIDDDDLMSMAIALHIEKDPRVEVAGLFRNVVEALSAWTSTDSVVNKPDAIVFDVKTARQQVDTIRRLRAVWPGAVLAHYTSGANEPSALRDQGVDLVFAKDDDPRRFLDDLITHLPPSPGGRPARARDVP